MNFGDIKTFDFRELCITEFDEAFKKFQSSNIPLSGLPKVSIRGITCNEFEILWRRNSLATIQEITLPSNMWLFHLPHPTPDTISAFLQHPEGCSHSLLAQPESENICHIRAEIPVFCLLIHNNLLETLYSGQELKMLAQVERFHRNQLPATQLQEAGTRLLGLLNIKAEAPTEILARQIREELRDIIGNIGRRLLTTALSAARANNRERILTRSLHFIRQNYSREMRLVDIVNYAHTTTRNLQIVFKTQVGLTPLQYIKRYRLMQFHKGLRTYGTVTEAAVFSGLRHMGRLSDEYRTLFGENPGDYLNRYKEVGGFEYPPSGGNPL